jgi:hypothetical protein
MDGDWEPPMITNPDFKGEWAAKQIDNPDYKGVWAPAQLDNPDYFEETDPYSKLTPIAAVTFELLANDKGYTFDNLLITDNEQEAEDVAAATWVVKRAAQDEADQSSSFLVTITDGFDGFIQMANEQPWIYALLAIGFLIPIYLCCCTGGLDDDDHVETAPPAAEMKEDDGNDAIKEEGSADSSNEAEETVVEEKKDK